MRNFVINILSLILILEVVFSCEKNQATPIDNPELIGDYEWSWSIDTSGNIIESTIIQMNYGIRINADGNIHTFENGKLVEKYRFKEYFSQWGKVGIRSLEKKKGKFVALYESGELQSLGFPYNGFSNYFYKHE